MIIKRLRVILVAVTAAMIALPELALPLAAMPLAQPGMNPGVDAGNLSANVEQIYYRRKFHGGGYKYGHARYGNNRYWRNKHYGYNNRWRHNRYGWNNGWHGKHYGWNNGWNNGWCRYGRCNNHHHNGWNNAWPWFAAGAAIGYAGSYYNNDDYYDEGPYYGGGYNAHVEWCFSRYRSYDPRTDTFVGYDGYRHRCRAPY